MTVQKPIARLKAFVDHNTQTTAGPNKVRKKITTITVLLDNALVARHTVGGHFTVAQALSEFRRFPNKFSEKGVAYQKGKALVGKAA